MTLWLVSPWWLGVSIFAVVGGASGWMLHRREGRVLGAVLLLSLLSVVVGVGPAFKWDWAQRDASRMKDAEREITMIDSTAYFKQREAWNTLTPSQRWGWRGLWFAGTGGIVLAAGLIGVALSDRMMRRGISRATDLLSSNP